MIIISKVKGFTVWLVYCNSNLTAYSQVLWGPVNNSDYLTSLLTATCWRSYSDEADNFKYSFCLLRLNLKYFWEKDDLMVVFLHVCILENVYIKINDIFTLKVHLNIWNLKVNSCMNLGQVNSTGIKRKMHSCPKRFCHPFYLITAT